MQKNNTSTDADNLRIIKISLGNKYIERVCAIQNINDEWHKNNYSDSGFFYSLLSYPLR
jgi:hypothetical protein